MIRYITLAAVIMTVSVASAEIKVAVDHRDPQVVVVTTTGAADEVVMAFRAHQHSVETLKAQRCNASQTSVLVEQDTATMTTQLACPKTH